MRPGVSNEEGGLLAKLAEGLGTGNLDHRINNRDFADGAVAEPFALPLAEIEQADVIVLFGTHIRHELPLLHQRIRKAVRARGHFPNEQAAMKTLYLVTRSLDPKGTGQTRWVTRWKPALNAFAITFADRMPAAEDN